MTEAEWLAGTDPTPMLAFLRGRASERKLRLFGVLCCRQNGDLFRDRRFHNAIRIAERYADGEVRETELAAAEAAARRACKDVPVDEFDDYPIIPAATVPTLLVSRRYTPDLAVSGAECLIAAAERSDVLSFDGIDHELRFEQADFLRDLFGNPFRPAPFAPEWRTSTAVTLAQVIYEHRTFQNLPVLADALEEAGCDATDLLAHCRGGGSHVRGCWAVDTVLGLE